MAKFGFGVLEPIAFIYTVCCVREGGGEASAWSTEVVTVHDVNVDRPRQHECWFYMVYRRILGNSQIDELL